MSHDDSQPRRLEPYTSSFSAPDARTSNSTIGDGGGNGPFDPGNTPPLVFAFITLGFTLFGIVIAVIYKRCRSFPNPQEPLRQRSVPVRRCSVQKPKLWHVWTPVHQPAPDQERTNDISDWDAFLVSSVLFPPVAVVDRLVDERPSPCQPRLYIPTLLLFLFMCGHNTSKATLHGLSPWKTPNTGWPSDNRLQTQFSTSLS